MTETLPQISLGTAAIGIFLVCVLYVMVCGMFRMMVGTLVIAASAWLGFHAWRMAPEQSMQWMGHLSPIVIYGLPAAVFAFAFILLRLVLQTLTRPFAERSDAFREDRFNPRRLFLHLPLLLIPTSIMVMIFAVVFHHISSLEEIRNAANHTAADGEVVSGSTYLSRIKHSITRTIPADWLTRLDPSTSPDRVQVAKLIAIQASAVPGQPAVIDPASGQPIPRAIIVQDVELENLARDGHFASLLRHPNLETFLEEPEVRRWLQLFKARPDHLIPPES